MNPRLLQLGTLAQWALPLAWLALGRGLGWPRAGLGLALCSWGWPFALMAVEMAIGAVVNRGDPAPRPGAGQWLRAWLWECRCWVRVFNGQMPWRARAVPDQPGPPGARGRRGVLLVHGHLCNRGFWNPWLRRLREAGQPVVAVDLGPAFASIDTCAAAIEAGVARLEAATGCPPLVVAHSKGGLAVRAWLRQDRARRGADAPWRVARVICLGTPHHGTVLAAFARGAGREMRRHSAWLRALAASEPADLGTRFCCVYSRCDNVVMPASTALLPGAAALHLAGTPHVGLAFHPRSWRLVQAALAAGDDAQAPPPAA